MIRATKMLVDQDSSSAGRRESDATDDQLSPPERLETDSIGVSAPASDAVADGAVEDQPFTADEIPAASATPGKSGSRWRVFAAISALLLTALTIAGVYLLTRKPSTVDQVVILTVPSGAEIKLDAKDYGHSPVKTRAVSASVPIPSP